MKNVSIKSFRRFLLQKLLKNEDFPWIFEKLAPNTPYVLKEAMDFHTEYVQLYNVPETMTCGEIEREILMKMADNLEKHMQIQENEHIAYTSYSPYGRSYTGKLTILKPNGNTRPNGWPTPEE